MIQHRPVRATQRDVVGAHVAELREQLLNSARPADLGITQREPPEHLGERLQLPPWLESQRSRIEAVIEPIQRPSRDQVTAL